MYSVRFTHFSIIFFLAQNVNLVTALEALEEEIEGVDVNKI